MHPRHALAFPLLAIALAAFTGEAAAQIYSAPSYPPAGYGGVPVPDDDDDDLVTADPDDEDLPPGRAPLARSAPMPRSDGAPYPYDPRIDRPTARIPEAGPPPERYGGRNPMPPFFGTIPPYDERRAPDTGYGARPGDNGLPLRPPAVIESNRMPADIAPGRLPPLSTLPPEDQPEEGEPKELPPHLKRQVVDYLSREPAGSIIIDTNSTYLYYVLGGGKAMRYGIGVGREGFTWAGTEKISKVAEWPDWHPPSEMIERQPYLPRFMAGGPGNPLGARALYLGKTIYRIHGTNQPSTIGKFVSSGCIRMLNDDVEDLYNRVKIGTRVVVLSGGAPAATMAR